MSPVDETPFRMGYRGGPELRSGQLNELLKLGDAAKVSGLSDGLQAGYVFAPAEWKAAALAVVWQLVSDGVEFSIEDLRQRGIKEPDKPQRWGSLFAVMKNDGVIELVGLQQHRTPKGDGNLVRRWRGTTSTLARVA